MNGRFSITRNVALGFALQVAVLAVVMVLGLSQLHQIQVHQHRAQRESMEVARASAVVAGVRGAAVENSFFVSTGDPSRLRIRDSLLTAGSQGLAGLVDSADAAPERDAWAEATRRFASWKPMLEGVAAASAPQHSAELVRRIRDQALPARLRVEEAMRRGMAAARGEQAAALAAQDEAGRMAYVLFLGGGMLAFLAAALTGIRFTRHVRIQMSERRDASEALRASEERYRSLFENMTEGCAWCRIVEVDGRPVDWHHIVVNSAFEQMLGRAAISGRLASEINPGILESNPETLVRYAECARTGKPVRFSSYVPTLRRWFSRSAYCPAPGEFVAIITDITLEHQALEALEQSESRFRQIAEHISQVFFIVDARGQCLYISPAYERVWGRPVDTCYDGPFAWLRHVHPDDRELLRRTVDGRLRGAENLELEYRVVQPSGAVRWIRSRGYPVRDASGAVERVVGIAEDVTELHEAERRLIQAQKMEAVGRLAGGVAHDFNNVLTVIQGYAEMLHQDLESEEARADTAEITRAVGRAKALTRQLLAFSRQQVLQPVVLDPEKIIAGTEKMLRRLIGEDIDLVFDLQAPGNRVRVDGGQLEQVLLNLAVNARDAMPRGGQLTIATSRERFGADGAAAHELPGPGEYVVIAVSDTGTGMTPDVRDRVFEPFFTTKDLGKGTGLGLATVFGIVKQSGGHITVYSEFGNGSTFRIFLPVTAPALDEGDTDPAESRPVTMPRRGATVLLAEDDADVRGVAAGLLAREGFRVLDAANGEEAFARAAAHGDGIDLVITDVVMPVMDGPTLVSRLRERHPALRSLFTSGYAGDAIVRRGVLESGVPFLEKPYTSAGLLRKVREVLDA